MTTKSIARKHHYLPQAYLAAFTPSGEKNDQFHVLDIKSGKYFQTSPVNVAAQRDFNRVDMDGHSPDAVENALAAFEGRAVEAIRRVINTKSFPSDHDWNLILNLLALIAIRNPQRRASFNASRRHTLHVIAGMLANDRRLWESQISQARGSGEDIPEVSFEDFQSFVERGEYDIEFHSQDNLRVEFNAIDAILPLLGQRVWSILIAPPEGPEFICSDHPVALTWKPGGSGPIGFSRRHSEVFFPFGRHVGFYGVYEDTLKPVVICRPMNVAIMNSCVLQSAERHVYSARETFSIWHQQGIKEVRCSP
jgi:hypothetical protein